MNHVSFDDNFFMEGSANENSEVRCLLFCIEQLIGAVTVKNSAASGIKGIYTDTTYLASLGVNPGTISSREIGPTDGTLWQLMDFTHDENLFNSLTFDNVTFSDIVFTNDGSLQSSTRSPLLYLPQ